MEEAVSASVCALDVLAMSVPHTALCIRNHVPWTVIAACIGTCAILMFVLRTMLARENKKRDAERREADEYDEVYVSIKGKDGSVVEKKVDRVGILLRREQGSC